MNFDISWLPRFGEFASIGAAVCWAASICVFRKYGNDLSPYALNGIKSAVGLCAFLVSLFLFAKPFPQSIPVVRDLTISGLVGIALGDTLLFMALQKFGAQLSSALMCMAPPMAAIIAAIFLGERLNGVEIAGMSLVMTGVVGVVMAGTVAHRKRGEDRPKRNWNILWLLLVPLCHASAMVLARNALPKAPVLWGTTLRIFPSVFILLAWMAYRKDLSALNWIKTNPRSMVWVGLGSVVGTFGGLLLLSVGLSYARAGISTALSSTFPLWVVPMAGVFNKEPVRVSHVAFTLLAILGIVIMVAIGPYF